MAMTDKNKDIDFHNHPLKFFLYNLCKTLPCYLWYIYIFIVGSMFIIYFSKPTIINQTYFSTFNFNTYVSISVTGLSFSLALFVACSHIFDEKDLQTMTSKSLFNKVLSPFIITSFIFLISSSLSLIAPIFIKNNVFKLIIISAILLGIFSLFSTITYVLSLYKMKHKN